MKTNRQWLLATRPEGMVSKDNFEYREGLVPKLKDGEVLVRNLCLSFDPTQRIWMNDAEGYLPPVPIGDVMRAISVGQVAASRHPEFADGQLVQTDGGWQDYAVRAPGAIGMGLHKLPRGTPPEMALSILGATGLAAYWGMLDLGKPQAGDTVLVSGAAGATGSVAGQIARIKGARVVGIAGGPEKCAWLKDVASFDDAIDYKNEDVDARIGETCPERVNVFFDNVGGNILETALNHLALHSSVVLCGGISTYNAVDPIPGPRNLMNLVLQRAQMKGFIVLDYMDRVNVAVLDLLGWATSGKIAYEVDVQQGFENIPETLNRLFTGKNFGKQLLKLADPE